MLQPADLWNRLEDDEDEAIAVLMMTGALPEIVSEVSTSEEDGIKWGTHVREANKPIQYQTAEDRFSRMHFAEEST